MPAKCPIPENHPGYWRAGVALKAIAVCLFAALLFASAAAAQKAKKPLSKDDVIGLLEGQVEPARIADVARSEGITFEMNSTTEKELRDAGADDHLIVVLLDLAPKSKDGPPASSNPPPAASPPILLIEATPGGAQVYVDDEPKATTSSQGRVKFSDLAPGVHVIRLSIAGYSDHEEKVELKAGQTSTVYATLAAVKAASTTTSNPPSTSPSDGLAAVGNTTPGTSVQTPPANNTPVATFLVAHDHGFPAGTYCVGTMAMANGKIHYQGLRAFTSGQAGGTNHSFDISADEIKEIRRNSVYLAQIGAFHIKLKKGTNINMVVVDAQGRYQPPDALITAVEAQMAASSR